jgi:hypothetical protein
MLTEQMTGLCGEIVAMRTRRGELLKTLENDSKERRGAVSELCKHLHKARMGMARRMHHDRVSFMRHLRHTVHVQRRELRSDLAGARKAWAGVAA